MSLPKNNHSQERLKRNLMRSGRRGTKEMDIILGGFFSKTHGEMNETSLEVFEALLNEDDHRITKWLFQKEPVPKNFANIINKIRLFNKI